MEPVLEIPYLTDRAPAPGRLQLVQRFVNTVDHEHGREMLSDPARLRAVLAELGLLEPDAPVAAADLERALAVRAALRSLALANNGGAADPAGLETLEHAAAAGRLVVAFDGSGAARLEASAPALDGTLGTLVGIVYTAMADGTWTRLKACQRDVCGWLFYDRSRNHSARWCQMAVCGNRTKTRAYRARRGSP
jgi:predicted RNA-binding Zn ribbon-like protein